MLPRRATYDDCESEIPTPRQADSEREATVVARHAAVDESAIFARRRSERALYVPSALPMCELKKALARADDEATWSSSPAIPAHEESPPSSAPTRLHREPSPFELATTSLDPAQRHRFSSNVDAQEEAANAGWQYPVPPLPALEEFAPIVGASGEMRSALPVPGVPFVAATQDEAPTTKRGGVGAAVYVATLLIAAVTGIGIVHGDLTRESARDAAAAVQRAAVHVVDGVKRL